jgi:hypothetical protein
MKLRPRISPSLLRRRRPLTVLAVAAALVAGSSSPPPCPHRPPSPCSRRASRPPPRRPRTPAPPPATRPTATPAPAGRPRSAIHSGSRSTSAPPPHQPGGPQLGGRLRHGVPDPDLDERHHLDQHLLHHHGHRRRADAQHLRLRPVRADERHARATAYGYSLWEFQVYGDTAPPAAAAPPTPPRASRPPPRRPRTPARRRRRVDGNAGTRWSSAASDPQWIQVDLGVARHRVPGRAAVGGRVRHGVPDPGLRERAHVDERSTHHHQARAARRPVTSTAPAATSG